MPEIAETLKNAGETEVVRAMARMFGIGGVYAEEVLLRARRRQNQAMHEL